MCSDGAAPAEVLDRLNCRQDLYAFLLSCHTLSDPQQWHRITSVSYTQVTPLRCKSADLSLLVRTWRVSMQKVHQQLCFTIAS